MHLALYPPCPSLPIFQPSTFHPQSINPLTADSPAPPFTNSLIHLFTNCLAPLQPSNLGHPAASGDSGRFQPFSPPSTLHLRCSTSPQRPAATSWHETTHLPRRRVRGGSPSRARRPACQVCLLERSSHMEYSRAESKVFPFDWAPRGQIILTGGPHRVEAVHLCVPTVLLPTSAKLLPPTLELSLVLLRKRQERFNSEHRINPFLSLIQLSRGQKRFNEKHTRWNVFACYAVHNLYDQRAQCVKIPFQQQQSSIGDPKCFIVGVELKTSLDRCETFWQSFELVVADRLLLASDRLQPNCTVLPNRSDST